MRHLPFTIHHSQPTIPAVSLLLALAGLAAIAMACAGCGRRDGLASLRIQSDPEGATVWIDGVYHGVTPCAVDGLAPGAHSLRLTRYGFRAHSQPIRLTGASRTDIEARLAPETKCRLHVSSDPAGATVALDGKDLAQKTPLDIHDLAPGRYEIRIAADGYVPFGQQVEVDAGHAGDVTARLRSKTESYYLEEIRKAPRVISNYSELVHHYVIANRFDQAGETLKKALGVVSAPGADQREAGRLYQEIATIYHGSFDYGGEEAIDRARTMVESALTETTRSHPKQAVAYNLLGGMLQARGKVDEAEAVLARGVENIPDDPVLLASFGRVLYRQQRFEQAAAILERLLKIQDRNIMALNLLAEIYQRQGKTDLAIEHRERVAALGKSNRTVATGALTSLAALHHRRGDFRKAAESWEKAARLQKDRRLKAQYQFCAANELVQAGERKRAVDLWRDIARSAPDESLKEQAREQLQAAGKP